MRVRTFQIVFAAGLCTAMTGAAPADTSTASADLYGAFQRAVGQHDFVQAKAVFSEMEHRKTRIFEVLPGETLGVLNACLGASKPAISAPERKSIDADSRNSDNFAPNDEMKAAVAFANGWGVSRDPKRATAFICYADDLAEAEWVIAVQSLSTPKQPDKPFLFCEIITSGLHGGQCVSFAEDKDKAVRDQKLDKLTKAFTPAQKDAYNNLFQAAQLYIESHADAELDMSGTLRGAFYAGEVGAMEQQFYQALDSFEQAKLPAKDNANAADRELNARYRSILKDTDWTTSGTVMPDGLRKTERLWLKYRDAWAVFGPLRYPTTQADTWNAWATRARSAKLAEGFWPGQ